MCVCLSFPQNNQQQRWADHHESAEREGGLGSGEVHFGRALPDLQHPEHGRVLSGHNPTGELPSATLLILCLTYLAARHNHKGEEVCCPWQQDKLIESHIKGCYALKKVLKCT